jgi:hypothetical protein
MNQALYAHMNNKTKKNKKKKQLKRSKADAVSHLLPLCRRSLDLRGELGK